MGRAYAQLLVTIWGDDDYRALSMEAQWAYEMLISQRDLNYCGVIPYRPRRWSKFAAGMTVDRIGDGIAELTGAGYVVVDDDTEELWVRSFMKHNKILEQTQLRGAAKAAFEAIESTALRVLVYESTPEDLRGHLTDKSPGPKPGRQAAGEAGDQAAGEPLGTRYEVPGTGNAVPEPVHEEPEPSSSTPIESVVAGDAETTTSREEEDWLDILIRWRIASLPPTYDMRDPAAWKASQRQRFRAECGADVAAWLADWPDMPHREIAAKAKPMLEPRDEQIARVLARRTA